MKNGVLIAKEDYGVIPNSQSQKPTLLKPGAQKLCGLFELAPIIKNKDRIADDGFVSYEVVYQVINKGTGIIEAEGVGECNSRERKYKNQDVYNITNTLLKMAAKRALIDATLNALGISSIFTQDIEDMDLDEDKRGDTRHVQRQQTGAKAQPAARKEPKPELAEGIAALPDSTLLEWIDYAKQFKNHPQKEELRAEYDKRRKAKQEAKAQGAAPAVEIAPPTDAQDAHIRALDSQNTGDGYARFKAAAANAGLPWESDADVAAFEAAVSTLLKVATSAESLEDGDYWNLADQIQSGDLGWTG